MNILLINHYAGSPKLGMEFRPYYLSREWIKAGHEVTIISASYSHVRTNQPKTSRRITEEYTNGIRYVWINTPVYQGNGLRRMTNMLTFVFTLCRKAKFIAAIYKPDIVIASSTYTWDNYPARKIAKIGGAKYIYEVHDLWPLSPMELGSMSKYHPFIVSLQAAENFAYRKTDHVVSMLPKTLDHMQQHGLSPQKWHYVPNGILASHWNNEVEIPEPHKTILNQLKKEGKTIIAYTGSIGIANALDNLTTAAGLLKNENIAIVIIGEGPEKQKLISLSSDLIGKCIHFLDPVPRENIPGILSHCDILYIGLQRQPLFRFGISPNKMLDYMMAGKPIIQAIEAGNDMVSEAKCGISIEPENPDELVKAIIQVLNLPEGERDTMGENGKKYVMKNYNYKILAQKMIHIFQQ
ncbi:MAG: glycosyltransferase family 4 protein [Bacteroidales bacterium]|nr:glycosyltransferase family 4 protein [Bacteroidales bacterium]